MMTVDEDWKEFSCLDVPVSCLNFSLKSYVDVQRGCYAIGLKYILKSRILNAKFNLECSSHTKQRVGWMTLSL